MGSNCIVFALTLYRRRRKAGREGYIVIRRSRWGAFPHVLYAEKRDDGKLRVVSYKPSNPKIKVMPPPLFRGKSTWGDL